MVAGIRIGRALGTGLVLVGLAHLLSQNMQGQPPRLSALVLPITGIVFAVFCSAAEIMVGGRGARSEESRLRQRLLRSVFSRPGIGRDDGSSARTVTLMTDSIERACEFRQVFWGATVAALLVPVVTAIIVALAIDRFVGLVMVGLYPLVPAMIVGFMRLFRGRSRASHQQRGRLASRYMDALRNLGLIRLHGAGPRVESELREQGEKNRLAIMRLLAGNQVVIIVVDGLFSLVLVAAAAVLATLQLRAGQLDLAATLSIVLLTVLLLEPLEQVAAFFYIGMGGIAAEKALGKALATPTSHNAVELNAAATTDADSAAVVLCDVSCGYDGRAVLSDVDVNVPEGARVAVVGRSGAGKSTLLAVLAGRCQPLAGSGRVAGVPLGEKLALRRQSAILSQRTWLFSGTIADNLRLALPTASAAQMWAALEQADLADDVRLMPQQLDSDVGERGSHLSGGQAQRLALARALLSQRPVLLLDEPTAHIDRDSERRIIEAVERLGRQKTVVMSTHRLALTNGVDQLWRVEAGHVEVAS